MTTTRRTMQRAGYKAFKVWTQNDNGGLTLVKRWHILQRGTAPRAGELIGGFMTREEAWSVAEDYHERALDWANRNY